MTYQLEDLIAQITAPLSLVVHVGGGNGAELQLYDRLRVKKLVYIEPIPRLSEQLQALAANCQHTEVIVEHRAVSPRAELLDFYETNNTAYSGFHKPGLLRQYFSDLELEREYPMDTWTLGQCVAAHANPRANNLLVIDTPVIAAELLTHLEQEDASAFRWILGAAFESHDKTWRAIHKRLGTLTGPAVRFPSPPPFCLFYSERVNERARLANLETLNQQLQDNLENQQKSATKATQLAERKLKLAEDQLGLEASKLASAQQELDQKTDTIDKLKSQMDGLTERLQSRTESEEKNLAEQRERLAVRNDELAQVNERLAAKNKDLESLQGQLKTKTKTLAQAQDKLAQLNKQATQAESAREQLSSDNAKLSTELAAAQSAHEKAAQELEAVTRERDELATAHAALTEDVENKTELLTGYQAKEDEQSHRQDLLDEEVTRFSAQLSLITEVLIGERLKK